MRRKAQRIGRALCVLLALASVALGPTTSHAQETDRLITELEITDRILERARAVVEESGNERAVHELRFAFHLQAQAWNNVREASVIDARRSVELTGRARQLARRAVNIASQQAHLEQRALLLLEQLERALEQAAARISDVPTERAERLLGLATRRLEKARESFQEQHFREAVNMAQETLKLLQNLDQPTPARHLERMFDNTRRLLERVDDETGDDDQVARLVEQARRMIEQAEDSFQNGQPFAAEQRLQQARELLLNALRRNQTSLDAASVDLLLEETAAFVQGVAAQVRDAESSEATTLIENALRHLDRARELRAAGRLRQALEEARVARNLARRAAQVAGVEHF
jgi:HEPN domain-containing protein